MLKIRTWRTTNHNGFFPPEIMMFSETNWMGSSARWQAFLVVNAKAMGPPETHKLPKDGLHIMHSQFEDGNLCLLCTMCGASEDPFGWVVGVPRHRTVVHRRNHELFKIQYKFETHH